MNIDIATLSLNMYNMTLKHAEMSRHVVFNSCLALSPKASNMSFLTLSLQLSTCQTTGLPAAAMALLY